MQKSKPGSSIPALSESAPSVADMAAKLAFSQGDTEASLLACLVAAAHGVTVQELFHHSRSRAPIAATRQLAMYLMHVALGRSLTEVGAFFHRDRTTVSYACAQVEDQRENAKFDAEIEIIETQLRAAIEPATPVAADLRAGNDD